MPASRCRQPRPYSRRAWHETARRIWNAATKRSRENHRTLDLLAPTLSTRDLFEVICERDLARKFFARLFEQLDAEARILLETLLVLGIPFHATKELAEELGTTPALVTNLKRRIVRQARPAMLALASNDHTGGNS